MLSVAAAPQRRRLGLVIAGGWSLVIALTTLWPVPHNWLIASTSPIWCLVCGSVGLVDVILNVGLFIPLGIGLRLYGLSRSLVVFICTLSSFGIELLQFSIPGRFAGVSDILTNTAGGALGSFLVDWAPHLLRPHDKLARLLFTGALLAWSTLWIGTAYLLQPSLPAQEWNGLIAPYRPPYEQFEGTVVHVDVDGIPIRWEPLAQGVLQRASLLAGDSMTATVVAGPPTERFAPIVVVATHPDQILVLMGQRERALESFIRLRASDFLLRSPAIRVDNAFATVPGDTVTVWGGLRDGVLYGGSDVSARHELGLRPSLGWMLLLPFERPLARGVLLLSSLWIILQLGPLAYWSACVKRHRLALATTIIVVGLGMGLVPIVFGLVALSTIEWLAAPVAIPLARWAAARTRNRWERPASHAGPLTALSS